MRTTYALIPLLLLGCRNFSTVEEACHDKVPGQKRIDSAEAVDATWRANCYRRLVKLRRGKLHHKVQKGTENHLQYMLANESWLFGETDFRVEESGLPGFTGEDVYTRMDVVEYTFDDPAGWGVWELGLLGFDMTPPETLDYLFPDPFWRQIFLQPDWVASGYAEGALEDGTPLVYWTIFYSYPNQEREDKPVVYPKDGQLDVPYRYSSDTPLDSIAELGEVGFPITVTFSTSNAAAFDPTAINPYNVNASGYTLSGPQGPVDLRLILPPGESSEDLLRYTLVFVPMEPLKPGAEYTFNARVTWSDDREREIESVFTTSKTQDFRSRQQTGVNARSQGRIRWRHTRL